MAKYIIDPDHSVAAFAVRYMTMGNVRGIFSKIKGTISFDQDDIARSSVETEIDVKGVTTGNKKRDEHLLDSDFLEASKYPKITFKSKKVETIGQNRCRITGDLTIRGITRPFTLEGEYFGPLKNPYGDEVSIGFSASAVINREDFGITWGNDAMPGGGIVAAKDVRITLDVSADLAEE